MINYRFIETMRNSIALDKKIAQMHCKKEHIGKLYDEAYKSINNLLHGLLCHNFDLDHADRLDELEYQKEVLELEELALEV